MGAGEGCSSREWGVGGGSVGNPRLDVVLGGGGARLENPRSKLGMGMFVGSGTFANAPPAHLGAAGL